MLMLACWSLSIFTMVILIVRTIITPIASFLLLDFGLYSNKLCFDLIQLMNEAPIFCYKLRLPFCSYTAAVRLKLVHLLLLHLCLYTHTPASYNIAILSFVTMLHNVRTFNKHLKSGAARKRVFFLIKNI